MRFYLDEHVPWKALSSRLRRKGHSYKHAVGLGFSGRDDLFHYQFARAEKRVLITQDAGFADQRKFPYRKHLGVIVLDIRKKIYPTRSRDVRIFLNTLESPIRTYTLPTHFLHMDSTGTGQAFTALIHQALRAYHRDEELARLQPLCELAIVRAEHARHPERGVGGAIRGVLDAGLERLAQADRPAAALLMRRFVEGEQMMQVARDLGYSETLLYRKQRDALTALAQTIWQAEEQARRASAFTQAQEAALAGLPPRSFSRLFGVSEPLTSLCRFLAAEDASCPLVAVDGMGGIGKTALAHAAVEELVAAGRFARVLWVTARQQIFAWGRIQQLDRPALTCEELREELYRLLGLGSPLQQSEAQAERRLRAELSREPTVIVLDNLETAADVRELVAVLDRLARPTKMLLTTRQRVSAYENVASLTLRELAREDALAFIHYHAAERNTTAVLGAPVSAWERIAALTDGNPLAIKLVIGQAHVRPLPVVLDDLAAARADATDLYRFIFRYSWEQLSSAARRLLLHMPLLDARGAGWEELAAISQVASDDEFRRAAEELVTYSLLNVGVTGDRTLYSIHRLTESFILSDLVCAG